MSWLDIALLAWAAFWGGSIYGYWQASREYSKQLDDAMKSIQPYSHTHGPAQ